MKKTLAVLLVLVMTMAAVPGALATDYRPGDATTGNCPVSAKVDVTYIITIPDEIRFGTLQKGTGIQKKDATINISQVMVEKGAGLKLSFASTFKLTAKNDAELPFKLVTHKGVEINSPSGPTAYPFETLKEQYGYTFKADVCVDTADIQYAGEYKGTMTFGFEYYS